MANQLFSQVVADYYKASSESINTVAKRDIRRKSLKGIMQESFFHGASYLGANFIAYLNKQRIGK